MLKRLIPMLLIVVLVGCSSGVKTEDGRTANTTINESTTGETVKGNTSGVNNTTVTIGDYVVDIPSSWINLDRYYYMNKKGEPPFIQISIINDYELSGILQNKEDFLSGVVSGFENGKLVNDFSETKYNNATGYMYSAEGSLSGYDVILTQSSHKRFSLKRLLDKDFKSYLPLIMLQLTFSPAYDSLWIQ